ncbi:hypothetical protein N7481_003130 [Penicillium waksmanii]|uniref:uncharacterized protein n=1 Tax=Penicillium waksmanii TaxID=69791 RepID=UPI0025466BA5|nr:uncharacterized protein N7481_003130 [Penicillium waksmanii]KAJ5987920.1 hypothetical protein N7481_003130 [Penicillium waksmanii]
MSPVLREAIILAAALEYEYIWIGSLCIIQDDQKDWENEAPKMGSVYGHAAVVFAAYGRNLGIEKIPSVEISDPTRSGNSPTIAREEIDHGVFFSVPENPDSWFGRGWCLQERFFAPRIVHFGGAGEELYFECNSGMECECGYISERDNCNLKARIATALLDIQPPIDYSFACNEMWKDYIDVCEDYTSRGLAFATDALPAVSSLMGFFAPYLGAYYAGLWEKYLIPSIGWEVLCTPMSKRTESYVAPSFPWASRTAPVIWDWIYGDINTIPTPETYHFAQVVDVSYIPTTNDTNGQIAMGHINLRVFITQMTIESTDGSECSGLEIGDDKRRGGVLCHIGHNPGSG